MKSEYLKKNWQGQSQNANTDELRKKLQSVKAKKPKPERDLVRKYFGVEKDHFVPNIKFECRDGRVFLLPYAHQPFVEYDPDKGIMLTTMTRIIHITGQRLGVLLDYLQDNQLCWVSESKTKNDNGSTEIFIEGFEITPLTS